jgi:hypothetical protein
MQRLAAVRESHASFSEQKSFAALTLLLRSSGQLAYRRPAYLEKLTLEPQRESLVADGDRLTVADGSDSPKVIDLESQPVVRALVDTIRGTLAGDLPTLQRTYAVRMTGSPASWELTLTPTEPAVARLVRDVVIDGAGAELHVVRITQANGDEQRMMITPAP